MINGWKGSMLEGGSRVPFIASWPAVTPAGKVLEDIVSFADPYATFAELAGVKLPEGVQDRRPEHRPAASRRAGQAPRLGLCPAWRTLVRPRAGIQAE